VINGGPGVKDKVDYSARSGALTITLCVDSAAATGVGVCGNPRNDGEAGEGDAILNTEIVEGGAGGDTITGSAADEWLYGNGGDDVLVGLDGNDHLDGGPGINTVTGGNGADICDNYVLATACDLHVYVCNAGTLRDCDRAPENACETDVATSVAHCGACGSTCPNMANAQRACVSGSCQIGSCNNGFSDCDGAVANGCEINTKTDASNCGTCGAACPAMPNAAPGCENGACGVGACVSGWGNCDGNALNGCEFPVSNDISNCGSCGYTCPIVPNSTRTCSGVACVIDACTGNFANCDGRYANGCETDLGSNPSHCGGCGIACPAAPNMGAVCQSGSCGLGACLPGWADCDANPANGCEVNLFVDNGNCGACGNTCGAGTLCRVGACETNQLDFTLPGITANGCSPAIEHAGASGDDRGGVAVSSSGFFVTGDTTTARVDATTLGSATSTGTQYDALTSDLATETVYAFGNGSGPHRWREVYDAPTFRWYVPATYFDRLFRLNGTTGAVDSVVTLGARIDVPEDTRAGMGFFAGKGRALVASSGRLYDVRLPSGQVVNLGAFTLPAHQPCETQGIWGVAEQSGGALSIVYVKDSGTIARTQVLPAGATTTVRSFTNLSDMCGFAVSVPRGRWFWHHEGASQFGGATQGEFLGSCSLF
jgi:Ca2+-binding RTX toxin-like protein